MSLMLKIVNADLKASTFKAIGPKGKAIKFGLEAISWPPGLASFCQHRFKPV